MTPTLTAKQRAFVFEYPKDFNATQAAIRAGFSVKGAAVTGSRLLTNPKIQQLIDQEFSKRSLRIDEIIARLTEQATANIGDFLIVNPDGDRIAFNPEVLKERGHLVKRVTAKTTVKYSEKGDQFEYTTLTLELHDAQKALELLGKHRGMATERITGEVVVRVQYENTPRVDRHPQEAPRPSAPVH